jgi:hypothetical protein
VKGVGVKVEVWLPGVTPYVLVNFGGVPLCDVVHVGKFWREGGLEERRGPAWKRDARRLRSRGGWLGLGTPCHVMEYVTMRSRGHVVNLSLLTPYSLVQWRCGEAS